jgi:hypothetical protein
MGLADICSEMQMGKRRMESAMTHAWRMHTVERIQAEWMHR